MVPMEQSLDQNEEGLWLLVENEEFLSDDTDKELDSLASSLFVIEVDPRELDE